MVLQIVLAVCLIVAVILMIMINHKKEQNQLKIKFYEECQSHGINGKMDDYKKQKAELIAKKLGCNYTDIRKYYDAAKKEYQIDQKEKEDDKKREELRLLKEEELEKFRDLSRFARSVGRHKRVAILRYEQKKCQDMADAIRDTNRAMLRLLHKREINSGITGGIADGLLGGVAGVAAYMDAEMKNAGIRAENQKNMDKWVAYNLSHPTKSVEYDKLANNLQSLIEDAQIKCISDVPDEEVFSYLSISEKSISISETGAFEIEADVQLNVKRKKLSVGSSSGVIDGTIVAEMYQDGEIVGSALMVLPVMGIREATTIKGIAIYKDDYVYEYGSHYNIACAVSSKPYEIKFRPYHLWIMEQ